MNTRTMVFAVIAVAGLSGLVAPTALAQNALPSPTSELGAETGNWGLAPFAAIPTIALRPEDRVAIRALEDQHIKERRVFEDKYEAELRVLVRKQAEEREALRAQLSKAR
jgi:hypothetical protein